MLKYLYIINNIFFLKLSLFQQKLLSSALSAPVQIPTLWKIKRDKKEEERDTILFPRV